MIRLTTLGQIELRGPNGEDVGSILVQPKRLAVLAYLAAAGDRYLRRESLIAVFWPEFDHERGRAALRKTIYHLRRSLGADIVRVRGEEEISLDPARIEVDLAEFEAAIAARAFERAAALYGGDFLPGFHVDDAPEFEQWLSGQRARLQAQAVSAALATARAALDAGDHEKALDAAARALAWAPLDESAFQTWVSARLAAGDRSGVLAAAQAFRERLREDLGIGLSAATEEVVARAREETGPPPPQPISFATVEPAGERAASPARARRRWAVATVLFVVVGAVAVVLLKPGRSSGPGAAGRLLVADFESAPSDEPLARALSEVMRVDLAQFGFAEIVSTRRIATALTQLNRREAPVSGTVARDIALREGASAILQGAVRRVGGGFLISMQMTSAEDERILAAVRAEVTDSTTLLAAMDRASRELRARIGESGVSLRRRRPLADVTTPSIAALIKYSEGVRAIDYLGDHASGIALLEEAVRIDTSFAMAYRKLGAAIEATTGNAEAALYAYARAYRSRQRLTDAERYQVEASYYDFIGEHKRAVDALINLTRIEPNNLTAWNNLGYLHSSAGDFQRAAEHYARAVAIDSAYALSAANQVSAIFNAGDTARARQLLERFRRRFLENPRGPALGSAMLTALGNYEAARADLERLRQLSLWQDVAVERQAWIAAVRGNFALAERTVGEAAAVELQAGDTAEYANHRLRWAHVLLNARADTSPALRAAADLTRSRFWAALAPAQKPYTELGWLYALARRPALVAAVLDTLRSHPEQRLQKRTQANVQSLEAAQLMARGDYRTALDRLHALPAQRCSICGLPAIALAQEALGDAQGARMTAHTYLTRTYIDRLAEDAVWLQRMKRMIR